MKTPDRLQRPANPTLRIVRASALYRSADEPSEKSEQEQRTAPLFTPGARASGLLSKRRLNEIEPPTPIRQQAASSSATRLKTSSVYEPSHDDVVEEDDQPFVLTWAPLPGGLDAQIVEAIRVSPSDGRSAHVVFREKEHQLGAIFAALSIGDAQILHRRLTIPAKDDPVASAFGRLTSARRSRLVQFLGDARRRAALERSRR